MILVNANLLLYSRNADLPQQPAAAAWWDEQLSTNPSVALCWPVLSTFIRVATSPRAFTRPLSVEQASDCVESWITRPNVA